MEDLWASWLCSLCPSDAQDAFPTQITSNSPTNYNFCISLWKNWNFLKMQLFYFQRISGRSFCFQDIVLFAICSPCCHQCHWSDESPIALSVSEIRFFAFIPIFLLTFWNGTENAVVLPPAIFFSFPWHRHPDFLWHTRTEVVHCWDRGGGGIEHVSSWKWIYIQYKLHTEYGMRKSLHNIL